MLILFFSAPLRKISIVFSSSKTHLLESLPVTLSLVVLAHLIFSRICIGFQLINALNSNLPHWRTTFSTPLNLLIYVLCSIITLPHVLCVLPIPIFCRFHMSAQPLPLAVLNCWDKRKDMLIKVYCDISQQTVDSVRIKQTFAEDRQRWTLYFFWWPHEHRYNYCLRWQIWLKFGIPIASRWCIADLEFY